MAFLLSLICVGAILVTYALYERRLNQRQCGSCGFRVSVHSDQRCPKCSDEDTAGSLPTEARRAKWARIALIAIPLSLIAVNGAIIIAEQAQPETEKAIRLVKESASRKENFTVQQYLYATLYYRRDGGEQIEIDGWNAQQPGGAGSPITVEFRFAEQGIEEVARWEVDPGSKKARARNDSADSLSRN